MWQDNPVTAYIVLGLGNLLGGVTKVRLGVCSCTTPPCMQPPHTCTLTNTQHPTSRPVHSLVSTHSPTHQVHPRERGVRPLCHAERVWLTQHNARALTYRALQDLVRQLRAYALGSCAWLLSWSQVRGWSHSAYQASTAHGIFESLHLNSVCRG